MESYYYYGNYILTFPAFPQVKRGGDLGGQFHTNNFFSFFFFFFFVNPSLQWMQKRSIPFHALVLISEMNHFLKRTRFSVKILCIVLFYKMIYFCHQLCYKPLKKTKKKSEQEVISNTEKKESTMSSWRGKRFYKFYRKKYIL